MLSVNTLSGIVPSGIFINIVLLSVAMRSV
jgi:hypothetical protein